MEPRFAVGDLVDHLSIPCKRGGRIEAVIERTVYIVYRVRWSGCTGDYFENELAASRHELPILEETHG